MHTRLHALALVTAAVATPGFADVVFSENFESGLGAWTGKRGGSHNGAAVADPYDNSNTALAFTAMNAAGDIFTADQIRLDTARSYVLSFDFLGMTDRGMNPNVGTNAYVGISQGLPDGHKWLYSTQGTSGANAVLVDNSAWNHYEFALDVPTGWADENGFAGFHLMLEDFYGGGGVAGDAYFDNFSIRSVPTPFSAALLGLGGVVLTRRRRSGTHVAG